MFHFINIANRILASSLFARYDLPSIIVAALRDPPDGNPSDHP
jgi:hypothetical protein